MTVTVDVAVIGAGITGLSAARALVGSGLRVTVLERAVRVGGKAQSEALGGFLMEHGPSTVSAAVPEAGETVAALGLDRTRVDLGPDVRRRYLLDGDRLSGVSVNPFGFFLSNYLSPAARLSLLAEPLRRAGPAEADESVHAFTARRFGRGFADKVMAPMVGGIFMGDARQLSLRSVFPRLAEMERDHGSVVRGMMRSRKGGDPGRRLYSWRGGIGTLPVALATSLPEPPRTGVTVKRITRAVTGYAVETTAGILRARAVLLTVQPHVAAGLLDGLDPAGADAAADIPAPPAAVVFAGYARGAVDHPLDGLGYLATEGSGDISGVQFCSTMFPGRAPKGHVALAAYVGGARNPDLARRPATELQAEVHRQLSRVLGIRGAPVVSRVRYWPLGLPQYRIWHAARRDILEASGDRVPGLFLAGNFLRGVSIGNCIASGRQIAERIADYLGRSGAAAAQSVAR